MIKRPFTVMIIRPLSISRGHGPQIIEEILKNCSVVLVAMRQWNVCRTTWAALSNISKDTKAELDATTTDLHLNKGPSWCLIFEAGDGEADPTEELMAYCGPADRTQWEQKHLRMRYSSYKQRGITASLQDAVVYISPADKHDLISHLLFG